MSPIRVLEIFREPLANGGQESFIMNMYRHMDRTKVQMDFLTPFGADNLQLKEEIESMGGRVFAYNHSFNERQNQSFKKVVSQFLQDRKGEYSIVHFHSGSTYALMEGPKLAAQAGIANRIVHSHCGGFPNLKYKVIKALSIPYFLRYPTCFAACSMTAAKWKFPNQVIESGKVNLLPNAVDLDCFYLDQEKRDQIRQQYKVQEQIVLGHIGRFNIQKNHNFLIDIFYAFLSDHPTAQLWLVGVGELEGEIREKVKQLGIQESVQFFGLRKDIPDLLNGMDALVLPSFFEGLPVVGVEAQACGLPVICSDQITKELPIESLSYFVPLGEEHLDQWCKTVEQALQIKRLNTRQEMEMAGYEVVQAAKNMENLYLKLFENSK